MKRPSGCCRTRTAGVRAWSPSCAQTAPAAPASPGSEMGRLVQFERWKDDGGQRLEGACREAGNAGEGLHICAASFEANAMLQIGEGGAFCSSRDRVAMLACSHFSWTKAARG